jgi:ISXO2-like transposase domain
MATEGAPAGVRMCGLSRQESVTAGTVFHRTRTDLTKWFLAAYLMGRDKRGVSAKFLQRELGVAYQTAWTMAHKLRHRLSEDPSRPLHGFLEADETFIGGRGDPTSPGRSTANPDKSLVVAAVEKVPAPKNRSGKHGHAVKRQHGFFVGNARIAVLPAATGAELGAFLKANVAANSHLLTDGFAGYRDRDADLGEYLKHTPVIQDDNAYAGQFFPIIHTLFSNIKAWLVPSWGQRQAPPALPAGVVLPVQSPQPTRRSRSLSDPPRCRVRHHHLRSAHGRRHGRRRRPRPPSSRYRRATCVSRIRIISEGGSHFVYTDTRQALKKAMPERAPAYRKERREVQEFYLKLALGAGSVFTGIGGTAIGIIASLKH